VARVLLRLLLHQRLATHHRHSHKELATQIRKEAMMIYHSDDYFSEWWPTGYHF
jgi:hypothetical protein